MDKINELMATEVMGLKVCTCGEGDVDFGTQCFRCHTWHPKSYTTDMNQAMECWYEFAKGTTFTMIVELDSDKSTICTIYQGVVKVVYRIENSAPLAICKAILKAKGIEIG